MAAKTATLHRMVMDKHVCPYGLKALHLLKSRGFVVDDRWLTTRAETDAFKAEHGVQTTPQTFIAGQRVGGYDDLRRFLGLKVRDPNATTYAPVIAIFGMAAALAAAVSWESMGSFLNLHALMMFGGFAMALLGLQKLRDVDAFATSFLNYDLLAKRWVPYASLYPFGEAIAGVLMVAGALTWFSGAIAIFIGSVGAVSVIYAVYVQKRELKCACVGGDTKVPLGFVSLTENLLMIAMGAWMFWL